MLHDMFLRAVYTMLACWIAARRLAFDRPWRQIRNGVLGAPDRVYRGGSTRPIWLNACGAGDMAATEAIVRELRRRRPHVPILLTTTRPEGHSAGTTRLPDCTLAYRPLDLPWLVHRALRVVNPSIVVMVETEHCPNLLLAAVRRAIPIVLVNGTIMDRDARQRMPHYMRLFVPYMLRLFDAIAAKTATDAEGFAALGVLPDRLRMLGDAKVDALPPRLSHAERAEIRAELGLRPDVRVLVAGSTHAGEDDIIMEAFEEVARTHAPLTLVIAPAVLSAVPMVLAAARRRGLRAAPLSSLATEPASTVDVVVIDRIGYLSRVYGVASVALIGGSWGPHGGHNVWEALQQDCPVIYGEHMPSTTLHEELERAEYTFRVLDAPATADRLRRLLDAPTMEHDGENGGAGFVAHHRGAAARIVDLLCTFISSPDDAWASPAPPRVFEQQPTPERLYGTGAGVSIEFDPSAQTASSLFA